SALLHVRCLYLTVRTVFFWIAIQIIYFNKLFKLFNLNSLSKYFYFENKLNYCKNNLNCCRNNFNYHKNITTNVGNVKTLLNVHTLIITNTVLAIILWQHVTRIKVRIYFKNKGIPVETILLHRVGLNSVIYASKGSSEL
ncbi:hypothetical protein ACJX0J_022676, partial [Zea mays]